MTEFDRPPPESPMPAHRLAAHRQLVLDVVTGEIPARRRPARWVVPAVVTGLTLSGGVAVASLVASEPARVVDQIRCYTEVSTSGHYTTGVLVTPDGALGDIAKDAVGNCAELWRTGLLSLGPASAQKPAAQQDTKQQPAAPAEQPVPALTACVLDEGIAAVFPGSAGTCQRLGLPELQQN